MLSIKRKTPFPAIYMIAHHPKAELCMAPCPRPCPIPLPRAAGRPRAVERREHRTRRDVQHEPYRGLGDPGRRLPAQRDGLLRHARQRLGVVSEPTGGGGRGGGTAHVRGNAMVIVYASFFTRRHPTGRQAISTTLLLFVLGSSLSAHGVGWGVGNASSCSCGAGLPSGAA